MEANATIMGANATNITANATNVGAKKEKKQQKKDRFSEKNDYLCKMKEKALAELSAPLEVEVTDLSQGRQYRLIKWQQTIKTTSSQ